MSYPAMVFQSSCTAPQHSYRIRVRQVGSNNQSECRITQLPAEIRLRQQSTYQGMSEIFHAVIVAQAFSLCSFMRVAIKKERVRHRNQHRLNACATLKQSKTNGHRLTTSPGH